MRTLLSKRDRSTLFLDPHWPGGAVVLKVLDDEFPSPHLLGRLINELSVTRGLEIAGVRRAVERTRIENRHALVLAHVPGEPFDRMPVVHDRAQLFEFLSVAVQLAHTLGQLHQQGIIHRDLKPSNIIVDGELRPHLIDFGLSTRLDVKAAEHERHGDMVGTLGYLSPEQTGRLNRTVDYRTDLYSLGVSFFEVLTGRPLFGSRDPLELVHCHLARVPPLAHTINPAVPEPLSHIIAKLLEKSPEDRYRTAFGLWVDLQVCLNAARDGVTDYAVQIGQGDPPARFAVVEKLYGRQREAATLLGALAPERGGRVQLVCIAGPSGVGKSALVGELQRPLAASRGTLLKGKFDQFSRNIPYSGFAQAFSVLIDHLLTEDEARLDAWRARLHEAVGDLGRAVLQIVPGLELVLGPQPEIPAVDGAAAHVRSRYLMRRLVRAVCGPQHPVVLFLDDLQWADLASLDLLDALLTDPELHHLLVVGAYRDAEVGPGHVLTETLRSLAERDVPIETLTLGNLSRSDVCDLIQDATQAASGRSEALAHLVHDKTSGNAFFVHRFLHHLADRGLLQYDLAVKAWRWDLRAIADLQVTDNVVELLSQKLRELAAESQRVLQTAACIGHRFELETLAIIEGRPATEVAAALWPALAAGLVTPIGEGYLHIDAALELATGVRAEFAFAHDRVQAAAYALAGEEERRSHHGRIAAQLLRDTPPAELGDRAFNVARHLNASGTVVADSEPAMLRARVNLAAASRALAAGAFLQAQDHADQGLAALSQDAWQRDYDLALGLHQLAAAVAAQRMDQARAQAAAAPILRYGRPGVDRARAREALALVAMAQEDLAGALAIGIEALAELGVRFPARPLPPHIIWALLRVRRTLHGRVEALVLLPHLEEPRVLAALGLMEKLLPAAFRAGSNLFPLFVFEMVRLSVRNGNSDYAPMAYAAYAIALCAVLKDYDKGYRFAKVANELGERYRSVGHLFIFENFIRHWKEPLRLCVEGLNSTQRIAMELGDLYQGTWSACYRGLYMFTSGVPLARVREHYDTSTDLLRWDQGTDGMRRMITQMIVHLTEEVAQPHRIEGEHYTEAWVEQRYAERHDQTEIGHYHNFSLMLCVLFGASEAGVQQAGAAERYLDGLNPMYFLPMLRFNAALVWLRAYREDRRQSKLLRKAKAAAAQLRGWARQNPLNYEHMSELVQAELLLTEHRPDAARPHYDHAIRTARAHDAPLHQLGLILQVSSAFFETCGQPVVAQMLLQQAVHTWREWGADALVRRLTAAHPHLAGSERPLLERAQGQGSSSSSSETRNQSLDFQAVMKASAAISAEIVMERLLERLVRIMGQHAGAQRGALLLARDGGLRVEAALDGDQVVAGQGLAVELSNAVCTPIVQYVARTLEPLVLVDAQADPRFQRNAQVVARGVRSVLCAPIVRQGRLDAVLYFENNVASGVFTPDRLEVLTLLSTQAGTAMENAELYGNLEEKVRERTAELERQRAQLAQEKAKSEELLLNILPVETARELKLHGRTQARRYEGVSVLFADIVGFSATAERMSPEDLVGELDECFRAFDEICHSHGLEKIKTIGDAYMSAGCVPDPSRGAPADVVRAGLEMQRFMAERAERGPKAPFRLRVGVHTGPVVAGVVGIRKFAWDIWGDTVNIAARMEQAGEVGRVNVSGMTWELLQGRFTGTHRGAVPAKNKGKLDMYFVDGPQDEDA